MEEESLERQRVIVDPNSNTLVTYLSKHFIGTVNLRKIVR